MYISWYKKFFLPLNIDHLQSTEQNTKYVGGKRIFIIIPFSDSQLVKYERKKD